MTNQEFMKHTTLLNPYLKGFSLRLTCNQHDAKDLVQETLLRCFGAKEKFQRGSNFKAWASRIMYNTFVTNYRKKITRNTLRHPIEEIAYLFPLQSNEETTESQITTKEINQLIDSVAPKYRVPFLLFLHGYHYEEIATILQISIGTLKGRIHAARKKLKVMVNSHFGEELLRAA